MIESFNKSTFESALPCHKTTGARLWVSLGIREGEYTYAIPIGKLGINILIRSSVGVDGMSAPTGEDSIRAYIVRIQGEQIKPAGSKLQRYITRVNGWQQRLERVLRVLYKLALYIRPCRVCGQPMSIVTIRRGKHAGKHALACKVDGCAGEFVVIEENKLMRRAG